MKKYFLKDLLVRSKYPVEKQMVDLVVVTENAAKFALFQKEQSLLLTKRVVIYIYMIGDGLRIYLENAIYLSTCEKWK